jgi:hypothetical protein
MMKKYSKLLLILVILSFNFAPLDVNASDQVTTLQPWNRDVNSPMDSRNMDFVGQIGGINSVVVLQGNYAYINEGSRLAILDISNPEIPILIAKSGLLPAVITAIAVSGNYAFVAAQGLNVFDVSDPANPELVFQANTPWTVRNLSISGNYIFLANLGAGLMILDVSEPTTPVQVSVYDPHGRINDVITINSHSFLVDENYGLRVLDISDIAHPVQVGSCELIQEMYALAVAGSYAYVSGHYSMVIIDISVPSSPTVIAIISTGSWNGDVDVSGDFAYVVDGMDRMVVIDISDPYNPEKKGYFGSTIMPARLAILNNNVFITDIVGLWVVDVTDPQNPIQVGFYNRPSGTIDIAIQDNYAYLAYRNTLQVVDISIPSQPIELGYYLPPLAYLSAIAVSGNYAYLTGNYGFLIVDISDPNLPVEIYRDNTHWGTEIIVQGNFAFLNSDAFTVLDITDPENPVFADTYGLGVGHFTVSGNYIYLSVNGLLVLDGSDPYHLQEISYTSSLGFYRIAISGNYAYLAYPGIRVVDISDPARPFEISQWETIWIQDISVSEGFAYICGGEPSFQVVKISNPRYPTAYGFYDLPYPTNAVVTSGDTVYVVTESSGLYILQFIPPVMSPFFLPFIGSQ